VDLYIHSPIRLHSVVLNFLSTGTLLTLMTTKVVYFVDPSRLFNDDVSVA
jgi:hypothetical protein